MMSELIIITLYTVLLIVLRPYYQKLVDFIDKVNTSHSFNHRSVNGLTTALERSISESPTIAQANETTYHATLDHIRNLDNNRIAKDVPYSESGTQTESRPDTRQNDRINEIHNAILPIQLELSNVHSLLQSFVESSQAIGSEIPRPSNITGTISQSNERTLTVTLPLEPGHAPTILCYPYMQQHHGNEPPNPQSYLHPAPLSSAEIFVLCCEPHRKMVKHQWPQSKVTLIQANNNSIQVPIVHKNARHPLKETYAHVTKKHDQNEINIVKPIKVTDPVHLDQRSPHKDAPKTDHKHPLQRESPSLNPAQPTDPNNSRSTNPFDALLIKHNLSIPSTASWSDQVEEELDSQNAGVYVLPFIPVPSCTARLIIEFMLILMRTTTSNTPRKAMRGILDNTRKATLEEGITLKLGNTTAQLKDIILHRHSFNHTTSTPGDRPPYLNPTKPECPIPQCLFSTWPLLSSTIEEQKRSAVSKNLQESFDQCLLDQQITTNDVVYSSNVQKVITDAKKTDFDHIHKACERVNQHHRATSPQG
jgi:hypothetical protein